MWLHLCECTMPVLLWYLSGRCNPLINETQFVLPYVHFPGCAFINYVHACGAWRKPWIHCVKDSMCLRKDKALYNPFFHQTKNEEKVETNAEKGPSKHLKSDIDNKNAGCSEGAGASWEAEAREKNIYKAQFTINLWCCGQNRAFTIHFQ